MFSSSSRGGNGIASDGSRSVHCYQCQAFIAKTYLRMDRALCAMCEASLSGKPVPEGVIRDYMLSKQANVDVSMLLVDDETPADFKDRFTFRSMGGNVLRALGFKKPAEKVPESVKVSRSKKRPRLFEDVDLNAPDSPMTMSSVDAALKKGKS